MTQGFGALALLANLAGSAMGGASGTVMMIVIYGAIIVGFYFLLIRPQKKEEKARQAMVSSVEVGDSVATTSGFYGVVIDVDEDIVIVEFGNNKNCRIPMKKDAISEIEKPEDN